MSAMDQCMQQILGARIMIFCPSGLSPGLAVMSPWCIAAALEKASCNSPTAARMGLDMVINSNNAIVARLRNFRNRFTLTSFRCCGLASVREQAKRVEHHEQG